ncbi:hypothetical protein RDB90_004843 [Salmonella enterica]|nr:hypothetical protein [Salmonella enterica]
MSENNKMSVPPFTNLYIEERIASLEILMYSLINSLDRSHNKNIIDNLDADYTRMDIEASLNEYDENRWIPLQNLYWSYLYNVLPDRNPGLEE